MTTVNKLLNLNTTPSLTQENSQELPNCNRLQLEDLSKKLHENHTPSCISLPLKLRIKSHAHVDCSGMGVAKAIHSMLKTCTDPLLQLYSRLLRKDPPAPLHSLPYHEISSLRDALNTEKQTIVSNQFTTWSDGTKITEDDLRTLLTKSLSTSNHSLTIQLLQSDPIKNSLKKDGIFAFNVLDIALTHKNLDCFDLLFPFFSRCRPDFVRFLQASAIKGRPDIIHQASSHSYFNNLEPYELSNLWNASAQGGYITVIEQLETYKSLNMFFNMGRGVLISMLIQAAQHGHAQAFQYLKLKPQFQELSKEHLLNILKEAVTSNHAEVAENLLNDAALKSIDKTKVLELLQIAAINNYDTVIHAFKGHPVFNELCANDLAKLLELAAVHGKINVMKALETHPHFKNISHLDLNNIIHNTSSLHYANVINALKTHEAISAATLALILHTAIVINRVEAIKEIVEKHPQFENISPEDLVRLLRSAATYDRVHAVTVIKKLPQIENISAEDFTRILSSAATYGHAAIIQALKTHSQFKTISAEDLARVLDIAERFHRSNVIETLSTSPVFEILPTETVAQIVQRAAQNGRIDIIKSLQQAPQLLKIPNNHSEGIISWESLTKMFLSTLSNNPTPTSAVVNFLQAIPTQKRGFILGITIITKPTLKQPLLQIFYPKKGFKTLNTRIALGELRSKIHEPL